MKYLVPDYYKDFICIADKCSHTCCAGWEIDVDEDKVDYYKGISGSLGHFFKENVYFSEDDETPSHFIMKEDLRCPFLNSNNLCDMILSLGEDSLCQICSDHPRYRNFFSDRIEMGLGLTCEAAGKIILTRELPVTLVEHSIDKWTNTDKKMMQENAEDCESNEDDEADILLLRQELLGIAQNRQIAIDERMINMLEFCQIQLPDITLAQWAEEFLKLEMMDSHWGDALRMIVQDVADKVETADFEQEKWQIAFEQLLVYLLLRHLPESLYDYDIVSKVSFAILGVQLLQAICQAHLNKLGQIEMADLIEYSRLFSSEIEYNLDNLHHIYDLLF